MADLNEEQMKRADARGRKMLETEPRAAAAHYDAAAGRLVVDLANGCAYAFPARRIQDLRDASGEDLAKIEVSRRRRIQPALAVAGRRPLCPRAGERHFRQSRLDGARARSCGRADKIAQEGGRLPLQRRQRRPAT
jgi:hypothetical protein